MDIRFLSAVCAIGLVLGLCQPVFAQTIQLGDRSYLAELPADTKNAPVIVFLHGAGRTPEGISRSTGLPAKAVAQGYAVLLPAGMYETWNAGYCCGRAQSKGVDDLSFLDAVLADGVSRFGLDAGRVYVVGMSNGAMMAQTWAVSRPGKFVAVAAVSGTLDLSSHPVTAPVPLLAIHGTGDVVVPFDGGPGTSITANTDITPEPVVDAAFADAWGDGVVMTGPDPVNPGATIEKTEWTKDGKVIQRLFAVIGGGHAWPGSNGDTNKALSQGFDAADEVLAFFAGLQ